MPTGASPLNLGRAANLSLTENNGGIYTLGNGNDGRTSVMTIQFATNQNWQGTISVLGRIYGPPANADNVGFLPIPYRRVILGPTASDRALVSDPLTGAFLIEVPANGITVALSIGTTAGFGRLYSWPLFGSAT